MIGNDGKSAYFSLEEFEGTGCAADEIAQVALTKAAETDFENHPSDEYVKQNARQLGSYYYYAIGGQAACGKDVDIRDRAMQFREDVVSAIKESLELIDN